MYQKSKLISIKMVSKAGAWQQDEWNRDELLSKGGLAYLQGESIFSMAVSSESVIFSKYLASWC